MNRITATWVTIGSLVAATALGVAGASGALAVTANDGKDAPTRDGDIRTVDVRLDTRAGKATVVVDFYRNPDSFMYVNVMLGRSSYGSCFVSSGGGTVWASFDPYDSSNADEMYGSIQSTRVTQLGSTKWKYEVSSKTLKKGRVDCFRIETAFMRDYERWDSDCECFTRVVDWDEAVGRL